MFHDPELKPLFDQLGRVASPQPQPLFDSAAAAGRISRFFDVATPDSFGSFGRAELSAIAAIVAYVEKTQKAERPPLSFPEREQAGSTLFIDPATRGNLELLRTLSGSRDGSLFKAIDRTVTGAGARLLADRLMSPLTDPAAINRRLDAVGFFLAEPQLCDALRAALKGVADMPRALTRLALNRGGPRDLGALRSGFAAAGEIAGLLAGRRAARRTDGGHGRHRRAAEAVCGASRGGPGRRTAALEARRRLRARRTTMPNSTRCARCAMPRAASSWAWSAT